MRSIKAISILFLFFVALSASAQELSKRFEASWRMTLPADSKGCGVVLTDKSPAPEVTDWVEPNLPSLFAVGFDTYNPVTKDIFNADGNIYDRPQREISLHWNGREIANRLCPVELKTPKGCDVKLAVEFVVGGAEVSIWVNKKAVYDRYFVPSFMPYKLNAVTGGQAEFSKLAIKQIGKIATPEALISVKAIDKQVNDANNHSLKNEVQFPDSTNGVGRVICTLTLDKTPKGLDAWDRFAAIYLYDEQGERYEIVRYITPYRRAWQWKVDVTDFLPLLKGKKKIEAACQTWGEGWLVSVDFDFYKGKLERVPSKVMNLWKAEALIGNQQQPFESFIKPQKVMIDKDAAWTKLRVCVTGHGMSPNTDNAAEFLPLWRIIHVGSSQFKNTLWKEDNYLNPCRPQGGTWKFDRAGWAPGDVVTPWEIDLSKIVKSGRETDFRYELQPYVNKTPVEGNPARHVIEAQIIFYQKSQRK